MSQFVTLYGRFVRAGQNTIAGSIITVVVTAAAGAEPSRYVCTGAHSGGLHFDRQTGQWLSASFKSSKYTLRRLTDDDRTKGKGKYFSLLLPYPDANWAFFDYGGDIPLTVCTELKDDVVLSRDFRCKPIVHRASFDKETRRFEVIISGAYVDQGFWEQYRRENPEEFKADPTLHDPSKPDDLMIEIGTCSPS